MRVVALPALLCLAGCTHLQTMVDDHTGGRLVGVPYALPTLYHDLTITREIVGCDGAVDAQTPKILIEVEAKAGYGRGEVFVIDPTQMKSWTKTTSLKLDFYANGTIKNEGKK